MRMRVWLMMAAVGLACAAALAQQEDVDTYMGTWTIFPMIIQTIIWFAAYLPIYAACLVVPMSYLQRFSGVDGNLLLLIGVLWAGGMLADWIGYRIAGEHRWLAVLIAMPLIFGWCVLIGTREWADLSLQDAMVVGVVSAVLCAPYFGPTWRIQSPPKAPDIMPTESRMPHAPAATLARVAEVPWGAVPPVPR